MNIDAFVSIPLIIASGLGFLIILALFISKLRNSARPSFVLFLASLVMVAGPLYLLVMKLNGKDPQVFQILIINILSEFILFVYAFILALSNPQKWEEKKSSKKNSQDSKGSIDSNSVSKEVYLAEKDRYNKIIAVNKDLITRVSTFFSSDKSMENFLDYCNQLISERVSADGCVILMADDFDNLLAVKSFKGTFPPPYKLPDDLPHKPLRVETNLRFAQFPLQDNIFGEIATTAEPVLISDSVKDGRVYQNGPEDFLKCGSYIFVPIKQKEGVAGLIALARTPDKEKFTKDDLEIAEILTDATATAMTPLYSFMNYAEHQNLTKGGDIATGIQKDLIPSKLPVIPGLGIGCFSNTAENVCGDYYDVIVSRKDRISFIMADVAGKGMNSLVVMLMIRAILRLSVNTPQSAATILAWANRGLCSDSSKIDHFASVALINYNSETKEAQISTCGVNPVFLYSAQNRSIEQISANSEPMGVEKDSVYNDINLQLNAGDILVTCTDGLIESLDDSGTQYSVEKLKKVVLSHVGETAKEISNRVKDDLRKFIGQNQQYDDTSLLVVKVQ
ncbi:MAG: SpoIIE family protein phosphatase [Treponema sp.]|nr:SpoIIE family protein phosphatase [Treponema sp.]